MYLEKIEEELEHIQYCSTSIHGGYDPSMTLHGGDTFNHGSTSQEMIVEEESNEGAEKDAAAPNAWAGISSRHLPRHVHGTGAVW